MKLGKPKNEVDGVPPVPGASLSAETMPAHWLLARLGKRVMRPGGLPVTRAMLAGLSVGPGDDVVDLAPGLGVTAGMVLAEFSPSSYIGLERGEEEAARSRTLARDPRHQCLVARPDATGLPDGAASVVFGEAVLTLETDETKERIIAEAGRLLRPGGWLGLHELLLTPEDLPASDKDEIKETLTRVLRVRARPLTLPEWRALLEAGGFEVTHQSSAPLLLLSPATFVRDEGGMGTLRFLGRAVREPGALRRLGQIFMTFQRYRRQIGSVALVARRP